MDGGDHSGNGRVLELLREREVDLGEYQRNFLRHYQFYQIGFRWRLEGRMGEHCFYFRECVSLLGNLVKAPINAVISIINGAIAGINKLAINIPDWVPMSAGNGLVSLFLKFRSLLPAVNSFRVWQSSRKLAPN